MDIRERKMHFWKRIIVDKFYWKYFLLAKKLLISVRGLILNILYIPIQANRNNLNVHLFRFVRKTKRKILTDKWLCSSDMKKFLMTCIYFSKELGPLIPELKTEFSIMNKNQALDSKSNSGLEIEYWDWNCVLEP